MWTSHSFGRATRVDAAATPQKNVKTVRQIVPITGPVKVNKSPWGCLTPAQVHDDFIAEMNRRQAENDLRRK